MSEDREQVSHPAITGNARWLDPNPAELLRAGQSALLRVATPNRSGKGERVKIYNVWPLVQNGVRVAWKMGYGEMVYTLSIGTYEGENRLILCDCPDAHYRPREGEGSGSGCRHARSLRFALSAIGLL